MMAECPTQSGDQRFPLFEEGPFAPLQNFLRLAGTETRQIRRRILAAILLTWVPLAVLAAVQGQAIGPNWRQSMLLDPAMYARYLVALPLLILATPGIRPRLQAVVDHFLAAGLVRDQDRQLFLADIAATLRLRDSLVAAVAIVALAVAKGAVVGAFSAAEMQESWRMVGTEGHRSLSLAGWWLFVGCNTLYDIVVLQLLFRLALVWRLFWKISRLDLSLSAANPDGAGGLAFLGIMLRSFWLPLFAIAASAAGALANLILHSRAPFGDFLYAIAAFALGLVAIVSGPLFLFHGQLRRAKERATLACGVLGARQLRAFEEKWLGGSSPDTPEMLQSADFSAIASFSTTLMTIRTMRLLPFWWKQLVPLAIATLLPFVPVMAIQIPVREVLLQMLRLVR